MRITRFIFFIAGLAVLTLGASLTLKANLGAGPWDALVVGQSKALGLTVGAWVIINGIVLLFVNAYLMKEMPQFLAAVTFVCIGMMIDFWLLRVFKDWNPQDFVHRGIVLVFGILLIAVGVAMYLQSRYPANPIDNLMLALNKRFKVSLMTAKTIGEILALICAIMLKGPIGVGTLIIAFTIGPIIQMFYPPVTWFMTKVGSIVK